MKRWNHYICGVCRRVTIARHDNEGVAPSMLTCRATPGCIGFALSTFFDGSQDENQRPHVVFYRPENRRDAMRIIKREPKENWAWWVEHYDKGGVLMKEAR